MQPVRNRDPARAVHEPVVVPVPPMPTGAESAALVTDDATRLTAWLHGRVQGVGMRWWIRARALELGVEGWARNTEDGRVEVVAQGPRRALEALLQLLGQTDPANAARRPGRVDSVTHRWSDARPGLSGFIER